MLWYKTIKIIDNLHVSTSNVKMIKLVFKKLGKRFKKAYFKAEKNERKKYLKAIIKRHNDNLDLYTKVMTGTL